MKLRCLYLYVCYLYDVWEPISLKTSLSSWLFFIFLVVFPKHLFPTMAYSISLTCSTTRFKHGGNIFTEFTKHLLTKHLFNNRQITGCRKSSCKRQDIYFQKWALNLLQLANFIKKIKLVTHRNSIPEFCIVGQRLNHSSI